MKDLGCIHYLLDIEAKHTPEELFFCQTKYDVHLLERANSKECKPISTPLSIKPSHTLDDEVFLDQPLEY